MTPRNTEASDSSYSVNVGANRSFLLDDREHVWIVERGFVDIFAVRIDAERGQLRRRPWIARIEPGGGFIGGSAIASVLEPPHKLAFLAVPARDAVVTVRKRLDVASRGAFDLDAITLIDEWVSAMAEFAAKHGIMPPRRAELLEAEPDTHYVAGANISAHHLDVLWVSADRELHYLGHETLPVDPGTLVALTERTWFSLPDSANVTAVRTPGAVQAEQLWPAIDRFTEYLLRISELFWKERLAEAGERARRHRVAKVTVRDGMYRDLVEILNESSGLPTASTTDRTPLQSAAEVVAMAAGAHLRLAKEPVRASDTRHTSDIRNTVARLIQPSGIRVRRLRLEPKWEQRDGPSFLGFDSGDSARPVALINEGRGRYRAFDPSNRETEQVGPRLAERIGLEGLKFYAPLADGISTGLAATREALRGRRRDIASIVAMGTLGALLSLLVPVLTGKLLGEVIPRVDLAMWGAALIALSIGAVCTAAFSIVGTLSMLRIESRVDETLQSAVWSRLLSLPAPFFRDYVAGDLADRANGVSLIRQILTGATAGAIISGIFSVFSYALLFWYNVELALWAGAIVIVLAAVTWFCAIRQVRHHRAAFAAQGAIDGLVVQMIAGLTKLRQTNTEVHLLKRWAEQYQQQKRETLSARYWSAGQIAFNALFAPLATLAILALIWFSLIAVENPTEFTLSDFLSFNSAFGQFVAGVTGLTAAWTAVIAIVPLFERVQPILDAQPEITGAPLGNVIGQIEFDEVTFGYTASGRDTLRKVSFNINPGERVAFVGPSGAGKSTIYRLILGFERPGSGAVLIDGHDLATLDLASVRRQMGVVLQHVDVIPGTIYKNIANIDDISMDKAWDAARKAGLAEDIEAMPLGMHTKLPEGGQGLSGGQKQRLLLARALSRDPRVLLLDEATSMLDNRTQATIQETLRNLNSTQVLIAHRLSTIRDIDRIYVMQDGRIVETGSYDDLMERDGVFAELARRQIT